MVALSKRLASSRLAHRSLWAVLSLVAIPWTVVFYPAGVDLLFPWGLVNSDPWHLTSLWSFLTVHTAGVGSLPPRLRAWPVAALLLALGVGAASLSAWRPARGDARVTAGCLALAGAVHLQVTLGLARVGELSVPVGAVLAFGVALLVLTRGRSGDDGPTDGR